MMKAQNNPSIPGIDALWVSLLFRWRDQESIWLGVGGSSVEELAFELMFQIQEMMEKKWVPVFVDDSGLRIIVTRLDRMPTEKEIHDAIKAKKPRLNRLVPTTGGGVNVSDYWKADVTATMELGTLLLEDLPHG